MRSGSKLCCFVTGLLLEATAVNPQLRITSGFFNFRRSEVVVASIVQSLCGMLEDPDPSVVEPAARLLGLLAMDPADGRKLTSLGVVSRLVRC